MKKKLSILGTRGIPAQHGGFETFAEHLAPYLVKHGWEVTVYCQDEGEGDSYEDTWNGIQLVHIPVRQSGALGTIVFDWKSTLHAARSSDLILTLGYNTAIFSTLYRLRGINNLINMDGIEWTRDKWSFPEKTWLYINERAGCWLGNHLIADHPEIKKHLATRVARNKITMIPYGADKVTHAEINILEQYGLEPENYAILVARPEPENSILEIVNAFSCKKRGKKLAVLGNYYPETSDYHKQVKEIASDEVVFLGAIYDKTVIQSLRYHACLYIHGHTVGGTNPSLVEALGAGSPILAHDNRFNRWVAGTFSFYFKTMEECAAALDTLLDNQPLLKQMREASWEKHQEQFTWEKILSEYERLIQQHL